MLKKNKKRTPEYIADRALKNKDLEGVLTRDEAIAIAYYTGEGYHDVKSLFGDKGKFREDIDIETKDKDVYAVTMTIDSGLKKLQGHYADRAGSTKSYRYHQPIKVSEIESLENHEVYEPRGFLSSTIHRGKKSIKNEFLLETQTYTKPVKFSIASDSGVQVQEFSHKRTEGEVLFRPGTQFEVTRHEHVTRRGGLLNGAKGKHERLNVEMTETSPKLEQQHNLNNLSEANSLAAQGRDTVESTKWQERVAKRSQEISPKAPPF